MEHNNLFFYVTEEELRTEHPDNKVTRVRPGVAFSRENRIVLYNKKRTRYTVNVNYEDRSGHTIAASTSALTNETMEKHSVKVNVYPLEISGYKPLKDVEKLEISADTEYTFLYLMQTAYTVTVHHMFEGSALTADTTVVSPQVFEEEFVYVEIVPLEIEGYSAETATIRISGNTEYTIEYSELPDFQTVDMGLPSGTLWAECNVGATSMEEFGDFFAYGDINSRTSFTQSNYAWYDTNTGNYTKYGAVDGKYVIDPSDDVATVNMGNEWHTPTSEQYQELLYNTTKTHETINGIPGILFTSNINGNTLFFPLGGESSWADGPVSWSGECGGYQTSTYSYDDNQPAYFELGWEESPYLDPCPQYAGNMCRGVIGNINIEDR